ncbi:MAG: hypothetical protein K5766_01595 [Alphaproteobacteria bacterium]|nr:hypothetical protein [Alphaproteobacteria bacterium]
MYKNFSYIFGLGALLLLAACDNGDKKATDGNQKAAEPQKLIHIQKEETKPVKEISSKDQTKSETKENDIYADINKPIESDVSSSEIKSNVETDNIVHTEELKTEEDIAVPPQNEEPVANTESVEEDTAVPPQNEEPVANTESANETTVNPMSESNAEKETQEESPKIEDVQATDTVNSEEAPKVENAQLSDTVSNEESPKIEDVQPTDVSNTVEPSVTEEVPAPAVSDENTEISDKIPELPAEPDASVISEEPAEEKSSEEVNLNSEPTPVSEETSPQEAVVVEN